MTLDRYPSGRGRASPAPTSPLTKPGESDQAGAFRWAVPAGLEVGPDQLELRLDFYEESIVLTAFDNSQTTVRLVSATDIALAIARDSEFSSGILPTNALWWRSGRTGQEVAVWRPPKVWRVALQQEAFKPPRRFSLPLPGLVFICSAGPFCAPGEAHEKGLVSRHVGVAGYARRNSLVPVP